MDILSVVKHVALIYGMVLLRYLLFAGAAYGFFYIWKKKKYLRLKIQSRFPDQKNINREVMYSLMSLFIFACVGGGVFVLSKAGYTKIYGDIHQHSMGYFLFSVVVFILLHDTYFYWAHRFMHWDRIYKYVHRVHHLSTNPTPWASFSFHPIEAFLEVAILPVMVLLIPLHPFAILTWVLYMTLLNVLGHLGFEIFPSGFTTGVITRWHNTSVHHNMHHHYVRCNYGLYFNVWDRIMGTNHANYTEQFEKVKNSPSDTAVS
jgi:Delta7-sterol 5-desaturase